MTSRPGRIASKRFRLLRYCTASTVGAASTVRAAGHAHRALAAASTVGAPIPIRAARSLGRRAGLLGRRAGLLAARAAGATNPQRAARFRDLSLDGRTAWAVRTTRAIRAASRFAGWFIR